MLLIPIFSRYQISTDELTRLREQVRDLQTQNQALKTENTRLQGLVDNFKLKWMRMYNELDQTIKDYNKLCHEHEALKLQTAVLVSSPAPNTDPNPEPNTNRVIDDLEAKCIRLEAAYADLTSEHGFLKVEHHQLKSDHDALISEYDYVGSQYLDLADQYDTLNDQLTALQVMNHQLTSQLQSNQGCSTAFNDRQTKYTALESMYNSLTSQHDSLKSLSHQLADKHTQLPSDYSDLQSKYTYLEINATQMVSDHGAETEQLKTTIKKQVSDLKTQEDQSLRLKNDYDTLYDTYHKLQTQSENLAALHSVCETRFEVLTKAIKNIAHAFQLPIPQHYIRDLSSLLQDLLEYMRHDPNAPDPRLFLTRYFHEQPAPFRKSSLSSPLKSVTPKTTPRKTPRSNPMAKFGT